jgi:hypothetical protein
MKKVLNIFWSSITIVLILTNCKTTKDNKSNLNNRFSVDTIIRVYEFKDEQKQQKISEIDYDVRGALNGTYLTYFKSDTLSGIISNRWTYINGEAVGWHYSYDTSGKIKMLEFLSPGKGYLYKLRIFQDYIEEFYFKDSINNQINSKLPFTNSIFDSLCHTFKIEDSIRLDLKKEYVNWD